MRSLASIQSLRACAALFVVAFHAQGELAHRGFSDPFPDLTIGAFGVDLFFVISGFIMVYSSDRFFAAPTGGRRFFLKRLIRIVPLYWLFTTISAAFAIILARYPGHVAYSPQHIAASYLFIPAARPEDGAMLPTCPTGWTLNYEMFFYLCFAAALRWRRTAAVAAACFGLCALVVAGLTFNLPQPAAFLADPIILEFCLGMMLALAYRANARLPAPLAMALLAPAMLSALLYAQHVDSSPTLRPIFWGLPALSLLAAAVICEPLATGRVARAMEKLGDASYSLYLVHTALFVVLYVGLSHLIDLHRIPPALYALGLAIASVASALSLHEWIERPVTQYLNRLCDPRRTAPITASVELSVISPVLGSDD